MSKRETSRNLPSSYIGVAKWKLEENEEEDLEEEEEEEEEREEAASRSHRRWTLSYGVSSKRWMGWLRARRREIIWGTGIERESTTAAPE